MNGSQEVALTHRCVMCQEHVEIRLDPEKAWRDAVEAAGHVPSGFDRLEVVCRECSLKEESR